MSTLLHAQQHLATCRQVVAPLATRLWRCQTSRLLTEQKRQLRSYHSGSFLQHSCLRDSSRQQCSWSCRSFAVLAATAATQTAGPGDNVKVHYTVTFDDGTELDSSRGSEPLEFVLGAGTVVPGFETAVSGLAVGETRKQKVLPKDGYGEWREEMQAKFSTKDLQELKIDFKLLEVGNQIRLPSGLEAKVAEVTDEYVVIDANEHLAGKTLNFDVELVDLVKGDTLETATFGGGCFWGPELAFQRVPGVVSTATGYSQGHLENPTYEDVCSGSTGHTEVVQVKYDPKETSYEELLKALFEHIDPTQKNGQGYDTGSQYRTGIYYHTPEQQRIAKEFLQKVQGNYQSPIATELGKFATSTRQKIITRATFLRGVAMGDHKAPRRAARTQYAAMDDDVYTLL